tara:strand:- start:119 stop:529 length:411 start_codon:yes stop_codon:yes gene_type:complete
MGYYSEVYIAVPKKDEAELDAIMNKHDLLESEDEYGDNRFEKSNHNQTWYSHDEQNKKVKRSIDLVIYEASCLKWYAEYDDVKEIDSFIQKKQHFDFLDYKSGGRTMVCVGEDNEVHSQIGDYWDVFNVYTKVEVI